jgi:hypothetical protein
MNHHCTDMDAAANLLERRWFAAFKAASGARAECEALLDAMALAEAAWRAARLRLSGLEVLRDALGDELELLDSREGPMPTRVITGQLTHDYRRAHCAPILSNDESGLPPVLSDRIASRPSLSDEQVFAA